MAEPKQTKTGTWFVRARYKDPITNEWESKYISAKTKTELKEKQNSFLNSVFNGERVERTPLLEFYQTWHDTFKVHSVSASRSYKILLTKKYMEEFFGKKKILKSLTKLEYQKFLNWLGLEKELAEATVRDHHVNVNSAMLEAIDMKYIQTNPCRGANIIGTSKEKDPNKVKFLDLESLERLQRFILGSEDELCKFFLLAQLYTGARYQEIAALTWDSINEEEETLSISQALKFGEKQKRFIGTTKTPSGIRDIDIPKSLLVHLKRWKVIQSISILDHTLLNPKNLIFVGHDTLPVKLKEVNDYLETKCQQARIKKITSHGFRHTRADALVLSDADIIYTSKQLGHSDINTTLKFYNRMTPDIRKKNKERIEEYMKKRGIQ